MADRISFCLDENIPATVAEQLRKNNVDVVRCQDLDMLTASDSDLITLASKKNRVLVTYDTGVLRLNYEGKVHSGIAFIVGPINLGPIVKRLFHRRRIFAPDQIINRVWYI